MYRKRKTLGQQHLRSQVQNLHSRASQGTAMIFWEDGLQSTRPTGKADWRDWSSKNGDLTTSRSVFFPNAWGTYRQRWELASRQKGERERERLIWRKNNFTAFGRWLSVYQLFQWLIRRIHPEYRSTSNAPLPGIMGFWINRFDVKAPGFPTKGSATLHGPSTSEGC